MRYFLLTLHLFIFFFGDIILRSGTIFHYRFKDGSGYPAGFKDMLQHHNLLVRTCVGYVGNRMHVLFHLAGILVLHCSKVKVFLETRCIAGTR